jgi:polyisoprenoid-binding protein YceI
MKPLLVCLLLLTLAAAGPATDTYQLNPAASRVTWTGYAEVGGYAPSGTVQLRSGTFAYDGRTLRAGRFEFDMRTIEQEQAQLAEHLRGPDFFDVARFPTAVFVLREGHRPAHVARRHPARPVPGYAYPAAHRPAPRYRHRYS